MLIGIPEQNDVPVQVAILTLLTLVGLAFTMILTPVLTEIYLTVEEIENSAPGSFGQSGALAQAVCSDSFCCHWTAMLSVYETNTI